MKTSRVSRARARQRLIRTILVPVDFSDCSLAGLTYAVRFAKEVGARIVVVHVADLGPVMMTTGRGDYDSPTYIEAARRRCGDQMKGFLKRVGFDGVPVDASAVAGYCPGAVRSLAVWLKAPCDMPPAQCLSCRRFHLRGSADRANPRANQRSEHLLNSLPRGLV
jgi:hypothetical protein